MNIWSYWEGPRLPCIDLCIRSMRTKYGDSFVLVTPETLDAWIPPGVLHKNYKSLQQPALRADCIRAALLAIYGGWWFDADTIALNPLGSNVLREKEQAIYMVWDKLPTRVLNGYIAFAEECPKALSWLEAVNQQLSNETPDWCSLGERLLTPLLYNDPTTRQVDRVTFLPIDIDSNVKRFMKPGDVQPSTFLNSVCYGLNYSWMLYHHPKEMHKTPIEWRDSNLLLHRLFCWAHAYYS